MYKTMKIYYDNVTGEIIAYMSYGVSVVVDFDHDYNSLKQLNERTKSSIGLLVLENGQYEQDFEEGRLIGVNVATKIPIFEYPNPENPDEPITPSKPLSEEIEDLKQETIAIRIQSAQSNAELFEMMLLMTGGGIA